MSRTSPPDAVVLYGRASFDKADGLAVLGERIAPRLAPATRVAVAFADLSGPSLPDVLDGLAAEGCTGATVVPCMVPADPTLSNWLAGALSEWSRARGAPLGVRVSAPLEEVVDLGAAVLRCLEGPAADVTLAMPSLGKPGWSKVPEHGRQLFFCVGARCLHRGAEPLWQHLRARMKVHRALGAGPRRVLCARSSCLFPCNLGPIVTIHPEGVWYGRLDRSVLDRIVTKHLLGDRPVAEHVVHVATAPAKVE